MAANTPVGSLGNGHALDNDDNANLQFAVEQSLQEHRQRQNSNTNSSSTVPQALRAYERSEDLVLSLNNEFDTLEDPQGDTVIYVGVPPMMPDQKPKDYCHVTKHFDKLYIVQSANLRLMGENSKFSNMLGPMSVRAERRLRKLGVLTIAEMQRGGKFKYYIDLRPPSEDEEAVILITDLTCTKGVLNWHLARNKYGLSPFAVLGHDNFTTNPQPLLPPPEVRTRAADADGGTHEDRGSSRSVTGDRRASTNAKSSAPSKPEHSDPEYSPLRHWSAIERLLHAIQGNNPKLDSAPKVWTFFAVARYFGCANHERVSGWITTWIYAENNANFIQCNPEVAYRIGMGIESPELVRDAFSILVGERALLEAYGEFNPAVLNPRVKTVHGRKLELLDDDERNRIDHAASSLVRRMRGTIFRLCRDMGWLADLDEYAKLDRLVGDTDDESEIIERAKTCIQEYVRSRIYYVLCQDQFRLDELEDDVSSTAAFRPGTPENYDQTYNRLNQPMRMFTKTFWAALSRTQFDGGVTNTSPEGTIGDPKQTQYFQALKSLYYEDPVNGITTISRFVFDTDIAAVNRILESRALYDNGKGKAKDNGSDHAYLNTYNLTPDVINFSSLAIDGSSKHPQDDNGPSNHDDYKGTPSKRRKTMEVEDTSQAIRNFKFPTTSSQASTDFDVFHESTEHLLSDGEKEKQAPPSQPKTSELPIRPRRSSILAQVQGSFKQLLSRPKMGELHQAAVPMDHVPAPKDSNDVATSDSLKRPATDNFDAWNDDWDSSSSDNHPGPSAPPSNSLRNVSRELAAVNGDDDSRYKEEEEAGFNRATEDATVGVDPVRVLPPHGYSRISPLRLLNNVNAYMMKLCSPILHPNHLFHSTGLLPTNLYDCLLCLDDDEFKYLPLWAGGNDDGTGGVYDDFPLPIMDEASESVEAFGPGRIKKAHDAPSSCAGSGSVFEDVGSSQALSTVGRASKQATDGTETVVSLSSSVSETTDSHSVVMIADAHMMSDHDAGTVIGVDSDDDDMDMEIETQVRSDDEDNYDDDNDDDDDENDTLNGDDEDISPSLYEHINSSAAVDEPADGEPSSPEPTVIALLAENTIEDDGAGPDDDFELI